MKKLAYIAQALSLVTLFSACEQEVIDLQDPCDKNPANCITYQDQCEAADPGSANFTKFVAIGSSYTAGFQAGALYTDGQNNSVAEILATAFECVGGGAFNQPTINSANGYNIFVTPNPPADNQIRGRFLLQGTPPGPVPFKYALGDLSAAPNPAVNPGFMYTGSAGAVPSNQLGNFSAPALLLGQALIPQTGNWGDPDPAKGFNPFYARFASNPGTSTLLGDAMGSLTNSGTFFLFWLGMDDVLLYAVFGGDPTKAPLTPVDPVSMANPGFKALYNNAIGAVLANPTLKGVVANIPDIMTNPHFRAVPYNPVKLDAATAQALKTNLADNYNAFLDGMVGLGVITADEAAKRKLTYAAGQNAILINDETLTDLDPYMAGPYAGLKPYARARQTTSADVVPLSAGTILGTTKNTRVLGVSEPVDDQYILIPTEITEINERLAAFNAHIKSVADANPDRLAFADVNKAILELAVQNQTTIENVILQYTVAPPYGIYSEDLLHPNYRGYAFIARTIVKAINEKFGSTIPLPPVGNYAGTALPINP